jgi:hypothetical protein
MLVSPQAQIFSDTHPRENLELIKSKMLEQFHEDRPTAKKFGDSVGVATVTGSKNVLLKLQDDLRKAGYKKLNYKSNRI